MINSLLLNKKNIYLKKNRKERKKLIGSIEGKFRIIKKLA
jgi:hypothetical protein